MLGHTHLFTVQYLSTITICRDVLQVIREREREREEISGREGRVSHEILSLLSPLYSRYS